MSQADFLKDRDQIIDTKEELLKVFYAVIHKENNIEFKQLYGYAKYYVGNGNNSLLVKNLVKLRLWWNSTDCKDTTNLVWTK